MISISDKISSSIIFRYLVSAFLPYILSWIFLFSNFSLLLNSQYHHWYQLNLFRYAGRYDWPRHRRSRCGRHGHGIWSSQAWEELSPTLKGCHQRTCQKILEFQLQCTTEQSSILWGLPLKLRSGVKQILGWDRCWKESGKSQCSTPQTCRRIRLVRLKRCIFELRKSLRWKPSPRSTGGPQTLHGILSFNSTDFLQKL